MIYDTPNNVKTIVGLGSYSFVTPSTYIPTITVNDYDNGYIDRFFIYIDKTLQTTGVVNYNNLTIRDIQSYIPNINIILNNPKQFWRGF